MSTIYDWDTDRLEAEKKQIIHRLWLAKNGKLSERDAFYTLRDYPGYLELLDNLIKYGYLLHQAKIEKAKGNYSAYIDALPGCIAAGKSITETKRNLLEAIVMHKSEQ